MISFVCNLCESSNLLDLDCFSRESGTCKKCNSWVRIRAIYHLLKSNILKKHNINIDNEEVCLLKGLGISDYYLYADKISKIFPNYINTFFNKKPNLDLTNIDFKLHNNYDFIVCSDVVEHILINNVQVIFNNFYKLLRDRGFIIFSVPFSLEDKTIEHFENPEGGELLTIDKKIIFRTLGADGNVKNYDNLIFHGDAFNEDDRALEIRIFCRNSLIKHFNDAGFKKIYFFEENIPKYGIIDDSKFSKIIIAEK